MDVDIDFCSDFDPRTLFPQGVPASMLKDGKLTRHPAGLYLQQIAKDPVTQLAAIPYNQAEDYDFFKIDFLHLSLIDQFAKYLTKRQLRILVEKEPDWSMLADRDTVEQLFQIHKHYSLIQQIQPTNMMMLADCIAIIRPHGRRFLAEYVKCTNEEQREQIRALLYAPPEDNSYYYKRPHSVGYAGTIVIQLHLISQGAI